MPCPSISLLSLLQPEDSSDPDFAFHTGEDWFHVDQSYSRRHFECVQGLVTAFDTNDGDGTLAVPRRGLPRRW